MDLDRSANLPTIMFSISHCASQRTRCHTSLQMTIRTLCVGADMLFSNANGYPISLLMSLSVQFIQNDRRCLICWTNISCRPRTNFCCERHRTQWMLVYYSALRDY